MKTKILLLVLVCFASGFSKENRLMKALVDDYWHFTNVGELGLTVTNYGIIGNGYNCSGRPSCLYKLHSDFPKEQVEHLSYGGLWVGGMVNTEKRVSTAIFDGVFDIGEEGFEFTNSADPTDVIIERSSIKTSKYYHPEALSHQDLICSFTDTNLRVPGTEIEIPNHRPLGINVELRTYAWNYSFAESFVILDYHVTNTADHVIEKPLVGLWIDASIGNMNYTNKCEPGGGWTWYDNLNGFYFDNYDSVAYDHLAYQYDVDGDEGFAESIIGFKVLGASQPKTEYGVYYNQWKWNTVQNNEWPDFILPKTDAERYLTMSNMGRVDQLPTDPDSWMVLISAGPFNDLAPGESFHCVYAVVAGFWGETSEDFLEPVLNNTYWAQIIYNGEDKNENGVLDEGEDLAIDFDKDGTIDPPNGKLDRYIVPEPPAAPKIHVEPDDGKVTLFWDNVSEETFDPISGRQDFEGYRIYSNLKTMNDTVMAIGGETLLRQFDLKNSMGFDIGLEDIRYDTVINGERYHYCYVDSLLTNGWPDRAFYAVTAYDSGDPAANLPSLESSINETKTYVYPGVKPTDTMKITVYPNPYRGRAAWDGTGDSQRLIWFRGLPERAEIKIYTLSGDLVDVIHHNSNTYQGEDAALTTVDIASGSTVKFSGGEHGWDLVTKDNQAAASGLYYYTVEDLKSGKTFTGKFLIIK